MASGRHAATCERSLVPGSPHAARSISARVSSRPDRCPLIAATTLKEALEARLAPLLPQADTFARADLYDSRTGEVNSTVCDCGLVWRFRALSRFPVRYAR